jgi:hypothetical protein
MGLVMTPQIHKDKEQLREACAFAVNKTVRGLDGRTNSFDIADAVLDAIKAAGGKVLMPCDHDEVGDLDDYDFYVGTESTQTFINIFSDET